MSNEELAQQIQAGRKELMPALWDGVKGFVFQEAKKAALEQSINGKCADRPHGASNDKKKERTLGLVYDFFDTGYLAVYEAAHKYDASRGALFLTFLDYYLKKHFNALRIELSGWSRSSYRNVQNDKKLEKVPHKALTIDSLNRQILGEGSDDAIELGDTIADPDNQYEEMANKNFIESLHNRLASLLARLAPEERRAIQLRYYKELPLKTIAELTNVPQEKVSQTINRGMDKLRKFAAAGELDNYIERHTNYFTRVSVDAFQSSGTSAVKLICMRREEMRRGIIEKLNKRKVDAENAKQTGKPYN